MTLGAIMYTEAADEWKGDIVKSEAEILIHS